MEGTDRDRLYFDFSPTHCSESRKGCGRGRERTVEPYSSFDRPVFEAPQHRLFYHTILPALFCRSDTPAMPLCDCR